MKKLLCLLTILCLTSFLLPSVSLTEDMPTLHVLVTTNILTKDVNELDYLQRIAQEAGVNVEWEVHTSWTDAYTELKSVMLASGDLPDVLLADSSVVLSDLAQFPELFADLNSLLDDMPNVARILKEHPEVRAMATNDAGQILGLFQYMSRQPTISTRQMINRDWLERLDLETPTTWDELYDVLAAFKANDANGNGDPNDEIPMDWAPGIGYFNVLVKLAELGVPVSLSQGSGYYVKDGVVDNFFAAEAYKELITFLHKCYADGLINENVFTQDYTTFQNYAREGRVGFTFGWDILDRIGTEHEAEYVTVAPMLPRTNYDGNVLWDNCFYSMNYRYPVGAISADSKNLEAAARFVDRFYDPINSIQSYWGTLGECIQDNGDGSYTVLAPADGKTDPSSWKWMNAIADNSPMYIPDDLKIDLPSDMVNIRELDVVYDEALALMENDDLWPGPFMSYSAEQTNTLSYLNLDLVNIFKNYFANWVVSGGVETQWDEYLSTLNTAGLDDALAIYQDVYDRFAKSL